jgi:hypothetical protein
MSIWAALGFIALGAAISEAYNYRIWKKYKDGMENGVSLRYWKMGVEDETPAPRPMVRSRTRADVKAAK